MFKLKEMKLYLSQVNVDKLYVKLVELNASSSKICPFIKNSLYFGFKTVDIFLEFSQ